MSCSARQAPPVPWNDFTAPAAAAGVAGTPAAGAAAGACARATELTELSTDWAAVTVRPALVRPRTKPRREIPFDKYFATSSRMASLLKDRHRVSCCSPHGAKRNAGGPGLRRFA